MSIPPPGDLTQAPTRIGSARIIRFPIHPVCVRPAGDGLGWQVAWRGWVWRHATRSAALADATAIASAHDVRVLEHYGGTS
jgi:hypothetical protein